MFSVLKNILDCALSLINCMKLLLTTVNLLHLFGINEGITLVIKAMPISIWYHSPQFKHFSKIPIPLIISPLILSAKEYSMINFELIFVTYVAKKACFPSLHSLFNGGGEAVRHFRVHRIICR